MFAAIFYFLSFFSSFFFLFFFSFKGYVSGFWGEIMLSAVEDGDSEDKDEEIQYLLEQIKIANMRTEEAEQKLQKLDEAEQELEKVEQELDEARVTKEKAELAAAYLDNARHELQEENKRNHVLGEGWDEYCFISRPKFAGLCEKLLAEGLVLFRAPPASGKTTMVQDFGTYCVSEGHPVYHLTLLKYQSTMDYDDYFRTFWDSGDNSIVLRTTFTAIEKRASLLKDIDPAIILIIDEGTIWWGNIMESFWSAVKVRHWKLKVLVFAAFGTPGEVGTLGAPIEFSGFLGIPELQLSLEDIRQVRKSASEIVAGLVMI